MPTLYRIALNSPPDDWDFSSQRARGEPGPEDDDLAVALWTGVSVWATETQARNKARDFPYLGPYIARLDLPEGPTIPRARTLGSAGHHTVWSTPANLHGCVRQTVNV